MHIGIVGGGPGGLTCAIALARRGIRSTVFERGADPDEATTFDPDRSYPIDITGHGLRALRHIDATEYFDARMTAFNGITYRGRLVDPWPEPGWIGSRGDILRSLIAVARARHQDMIDVHFECPVEGVDVLRGTVSGDPFDVVVGADGANSQVRAAMAEQVEGFTVQRSSLSNYGLILELDLVREQFDPHFLNGLAISPFALAGTVSDDSCVGGHRWVAVIGTNHPETFASPRAAHDWLRRHVPRALEAASDSAIRDFAGRRPVPLGRQVTCSAVSGGRAVLLGDAAVVFPPIGQGCNAALESAVVFDECLGEGPLESVGQRYEAAWKPQADALSWLGSQVRYQDPLTVLKALVGAALGINVVQMSKSSTLTYADVRRAAQRLGPLGR